MALGFADAKKSFGQASYYVAYINLVVPLSSRSKKANPKQIQKVGTNDNWTVDVLLLRT